MKINFKIIGTVLGIGLLLFCFVGCSNSNDYNKYNSIQMSRMTDEELEQAITDLEKSAEESHTYNGTNINLSYAIMYQNELILRRLDRLEKVLVY